MFGLTGVVEIDSIGLTNFGVLIRSVVFKFFRLLYKFLGGFGVKFALRCPELNLAWYFSFWVFIDFSVGVSIVVKTCSFLFLVFEMGRLVLRSVLEDFSVTFVIFSGVDGCFVVSENRLRVGRGLTAAFVGNSSLSNSSSCPRKF